MNRKILFIKNYCFSKMREKKAQPENIRKYLEGRKIIGNKKVLSGREVNQLIYDAILSGQPFLAGRFGANELSAVKTFDFEIKSKYQKVMNYLCTGAGFFPYTVENGIKFKNMMLDAIPESDVMGIWLLPFEDYYLKKYGKEGLRTTYLLDLEPWSTPDNPWSAALKGKIVLVIHPFSELIQKQYARREFIFPGTDILPDFELKTLKAVQTIAGEKDERFETWFDALEWMYQEALRIDFDVAIIGCGAYGFPLAAKLKQAGKQAIHLAGATQLLFGIKGKRWETNPAFEYVQKYFNDDWVYPGEAERPQKAFQVEGGCYW